MPTAVRLQVRTIYRAARRRCGPHDIHGKSSAVAAFAETPRTILSRKGGRGGETDRKMDQTGEAKEALWR